MSYARITDPAARSPVSPIASRGAKKRGIGHGNHPNSIANLRAPTHENPSNPNGRPVGSKNQVDRVLKRDCTLRALAMSGTLPLEYMLTVMRDENAEIERRDEMARAAAPFLHPRLQSVEVKAEHVIKKVARTPMSKEEWAAKYGAPELPKLTNGNGNGSAH